MATYKTPSYNSYYLPRLITQEPHAIIAGATGSGKSTLIDTILFELCSRAPCQNLIAIIDLKKISLLTWKNFPHVISYADTAGKAQHLIKQLSATMESRYNEMQAGNERKYNGTHIYLIIDESADLIATCKSALPDIIHIMRLGRASNIHIIYATQAPDKKTIPAGIQQNVSCLVGLRCRDAIASRQIIGCAGCESLPKYGKCLVYTPDLQTVTQFDVKMRSDNEINDLLTWWQTPGNITYSRQELRQRKRERAKQTIKQIIKFFRA